MKTSIYTFEQVKDETMQILKDFKINAEIPEEIKTVSALLHWRKIQIKLALGATLEHEKDIVTLHKSKDTLNKMVSALSYNKIAVRWA